MGLLTDYLPDWLPADQQKADATRMGLLNFGAAMLANANQGFGGALGHGLTSGVQGYQSGLKNNLEMQQKQMQANWMKQLAGEMGGQPGTTANVSDALKTGAEAGSVGPTVQNASLLTQTQQAPRRPTGPSLQTMQIGAMLGMKNIEPLFNMYKYQTDGIERKPGSFYVNPTTGQREYVNDPTKGINYDPAANAVSPITGFNENAAALEGAKTTAQKEAESRFSLLPLGYVNQDGRPIGGTIGSYINNVAEPTGARPAITAPSPPAQRSPQQAAPAGFPTISPQVQQGRDSERYQIIKAEYDSETDPKNKQALARELYRIHAGNAPVLQSEAEKKQQLGQIEIDQKRQERQALSPLEIQQAAQSKINDNWITATHNPVQEAGNAARAMTSQLDTLTNVNFQTGWGAEAKAGAANVLAALGVKDAAKYASDAQKFQQVAMERNMTMLGAQKGPQTEGDSQRAQQTFVMLKNTPQANQYIADLTRANANLAAKKASFYADALPLARQQGDLTEIDRRWSTIAGSIWNDPAMQKYKGRK